MESDTIDLHEVYPYLRVDNTAEAINFYRLVFDAKELFRLSEPSGRIGHADIKIGPTTIMRADEYPEHGIRGPRSLGGPRFRFICTSVTWTARSNRRSAPALRSLDHSRINSTGSAPARYVIHSATNGYWAGTWRL
jgi:glyoxalase/bleomycin resistance protein/dioxygenase superfamily protein